MDLYMSVAVGCVFVQVALTFWSILTMGKARLAELSQKETSMRDVALSPRNFSSDRARAMQNNAHNQFETPILLFAGVGLAAALSVSNLAIALGALAYVVSRVVHRMVHVGSNRLGLRFQIFVGGLLALMVLWLGLGVGLLLG